MASSRTIPHPLSVIWISLFPPASTLILIRDAPASSEFSSNSFTTDAGRSTTSPAAILLATTSERTWILPMVGVASDQWPVVSFADGVGKAKEPPPVWGGHSCPPPLTLISLWND